MVNCLQSLGKEHAISLLREIALEGREEGPEGIGEVRTLWDQHAAVRVKPATPLAVGDLVGFGVSHPCTTFDRWPVVLRVDEGYTVTVIGRNKRDYVWIMARTPTLTDADYEALVRRIAAWGYDVGKLRKVPQRWPEAS